MSRLANLGAFFMNRPSDDETTPQQHGGHVEVYAPVAGKAFLVGDCVYNSAAGGIVDKSATIANYAHCAVGIVVAGRYAPAWADVPTPGFSTQMVGQTATAANEGMVYVQNTGHAWAIAGGTIAVGDPVIPDSGTAGRVATDAAPTTFKNNSIGVAVTAATVGLAVKIKLKL